MTFIEMFLKELEAEAKTTRKMLALIPADKLDWKPHEKSMSFRQLATHLAELPSWAKMVLTTSGIDFATMDYTPAEVNNALDLVTLHDRSVAESKEQLEKSKDEDLDPMWTMRSGEQIFSTTSRAEVIRGAYNQVVHHRAQLGVFLRLLHIPIPGSYGPSADDNSF